ncbi:hypothetical protein E4631_02645 [Hymenobacter sp. UV11]|uniref:hypothetical protein n=1 Tax=Hymenobacter sp. UV11 TaxID=1849735 RepID=UPI00105B9929|nr:hypothetical protein [Hymenobacter sp. UV11]TDN37768.1 hypothetical protein A8B98_04465 [Hymenobacter sp. UV11]TFZ68970.1 hypothetical protein E4631_02645 [Hymenobacter sp. UV11]
MLQEVPLTDQLDWVSKLPQEFDVYLKILFPIGIDHHIPLEEYSFKRKTIAELNARAAFWRKYGIGSPAANDEGLTPIKYCELAQIWGIPYNDSFTPDHISARFGE